MVTDQAEIFKLVSRLGIFEMGQNIMRKTRSLRCRPVRENSQMHSSLKLQVWKAARNQDDGECEMWVDKALKEGGDDVSWELVNGGRRW